MNEESRSIPLEVLIVDDDVNIRKTLTYCLTGEGVNVSAVSNGTDAWMEVNERFFDLIFLDLKLGHEDGIEFIPKFLASSPWVKIVVITAHASIETAVEAMRRGAVDYIAKPFTSSQIKFLVKRIARIRELETEITALKENMKRFGPDIQIKSQNPLIQRLIETARKAAASEAIILLRGESGTGKSVFARAIHHWSPRSQKPMAVVSCPAVPSELLESELFGHAKGSFTGAIRDYPGRIAACEGGTLFLDEISEMASVIQSKMLRFIQDKEYERLGESIVRKADVRIIAASNADLETRVRDGSFREDLFYRLNVISLEIPSLKNRTEDIIQLATEFLVQFSRSNHKSILGFSEESVKALLSYNWPGNIRELRNTVERGVILGGGKYIELTDLPENISRCTGMEIPAIGSLVEISAVEELHIRKVLARTGSIQEAAAVLGIDQATLWRKRKKYGI